MRNLITQYVSEERAMIGVSKQQAKGLLLGVQAKDLLTSPQDFKAFIIERATNRFVHKIIQKSMQTGFDFGQKLNDLSRQQIPKQVKIVKT